MMASTVLGTRLTISPNYLFLVCVHIKYIKSSEFVNISSINDFPNDQAILE